MIFAQYMWSVCAHPRREVRSADCQIFSRALRVTLSGCAGEHAGCASGRTRDATHRGSDRYGEVRAGLR